MLPFLARTCTAFTCGCLWVATLGSNAAASQQAPPATPDAPAAKPASTPTPDAKPASDEAKKVDEAAGEKGGDATEAKNSVPLGPLHASLFKDLEGNPVSLADSAGKPMVIEMWATWCGPCRKQRATIHRLAKEFPDVVFVAASTDEKGPDAVKAFLAKNPDGGEGPARIRDLMATPQFRAIVAKVRKENTIPQTVYVSRKGEIADVALGQQDERFMRAVLKNLLKAKVPGGATNEGATSESAQGERKDAPPKGESAEPTQKNTESGTPSGAPASR